MFSFWTNMSEKRRGYILMILGVLILFDAMGLLSKAIHVVIVLSALAIIVYGLILTRLIDQVNKWVHGDKR